MTVFAGPNGAGKSALTQRFDFEGTDNLLDPDVIAKSLNPLNPAQTGGTAGREVIRRTHGYLEKGESFAIETTLSGMRILGVIRSALENDYFVRVIYVCLDDPEHCVARVRERVSLGGHDVAGEDVRRRYPRSLQNLRKLTSRVQQSSCL